MQFMASQHRLALLEWSDRVNNTLAESEETAAAEAVQQAIKQYQNDHFMIAVVGKAKRGKSTLLNAVLGRSDDLVAPVDKLPASSSITRFFWAEEPSAKVIFRDARTEIIPYERIREFVTEDMNPKNAKEVDIVEVTGPFPGLDKDVILVDTPGAGSVHEYHDAILHAFIPQADAIIFLVTARMPLDQDELELLQNIKAADIKKVFFAINRVDEAEEPDIEQAVAHNRLLLSQAGISVDRIHRISAKNAFLGKLAESGVPEFLDDISVFLARNKARFFNQRLVNNVVENAESCEHNASIQAACALKSAAQIDADIRSLNESKRTIERERGLSEREFKKEWTAAIDQFERDAREAKSAVAAKVNKALAATSVFGVSKLSKNLPTILVRAVEKELAASSEVLEASLSSASHKLQAAYPAVMIADAGEVSIRSSAGSSVVIAGLGGAAAIATGVGLTTAGASAAAAISAAAAAAAAVPTVTTVTSIAPAASLLASWASWLGFSGAAAGITSAGTATGTVVIPAAVAAPVTLPLWVALSGPVGWTLAGIGILAVPIAWRSSKIKQRDKLEDAAQEELSTIFKRILGDRIPALRKMCDSIVEDFQIRLDRQISQIETTLQNSKENRPDSSRVAVLETFAKELKRLRDEGFAILAQE